MQAAVRSFINKADFNTGRNSKVSTEYSERFPEEVKLFLYKEPLEEKSTSDFEELTHNYYLFFQKNYWTQYSLSINMVEKEKKNTRKNIVKAGSHITQRWDIKQGDYFSKQDANRLMAGNRLDKNEKIVLTSFIAGIGWLLFQVLDLLFRFS